jgi:hypothetical protein
MPAQDSKEVRPVRLAGGDVYPSTLSTMSTQTEQKLIYPYELCSTREKQRYYPLRFREERRDEWMDAWFTAVYGGSDHLLGISTILFVRDLIVRNMARRRYSYNFSKAQQSA